MHDSLAEQKLPPKEAALGALLPCGKVQTTARDPRHRHETGTATAPPPHQQQPDKAQNDSTSPKTQPLDLTQEDPFTTQPTVIGRVGRTAVRVFKNP